MPALLCRALEAHPLAAPRSAAPKAKRAVRAKARRHLLQGQAATQEVVARVSTSTPDAFTNGWFGLKVEDMVSLNNGFYRQPTDLALCKSKSHVVEVGNSLVCVRSTCDSLVG